MGEVRPVIDDVGLLDRENWVPTATGLGGEEAMTEDRQQLGPGREVASRNLQSGAELLRLLAPALQPEAGVFDVELNALQHPSDRLVVLPLFEIPPGKEDAARILQVLEQ